jgi:hypothetical protein
MAEDRAMVGAGLRQRGIITLADDAYFPGVRALVLSVAGFCPVTIYDLGLGEAARTWVAERPDVEILQLPATPLVSAARSACGDSPAGKKALKKEWPLWIPPELIGAAPYREVFFIDGDAVILRDMPQLFETLQEGPFVTEESFAPLVANNPEVLHAQLPFSLVSSIASASGDGPVPPLHVNSGVSGWIPSRDQALIAAYALPGRRIFLEGTLPKSSIRWHAQGALTWALQAFGYRQQDLQPRRWNRCARHTGAIDQCFSPQASDQEIELFLERCRQRVPDAAVLHWNGCPLPWLLRP